MERGARAGPSLQSSRVRVRVHGVQLSSRGALWPDRGHVEGLETRRKRRAGGAVASGDRSEEGETRR